MQLMTYLFISLLLIKTFLEFEALESRGLIYLEFSRFFKSLFETVIIDPKVNRNLSGYVRLVILRLLATLYPGYLAFCVSLNKVFGWRYDFRFL